jgi:hypothetical protein
MSTWPVGLAARMATAARSRSATSTWRRAGASSAISGTSPPSAQLTRIPSRSSAGRRDSTASSTTRLTEWRSRPPLVEGSAASMFRTTRVAASARS